MGHGAVSANRVSHFTIIHDAESSNLAWISQSLECLGISPARISLDAGLGEPIANWAKRVGTSPEIRAGARRLVGKKEKTFRIPCAWRSILSDTINREIYHRESETFTGAPPIATNNRVFLHIPAYRYFFKQCKEIEKNDRKNKNLLQPS